HRADREVGKLQHAEEQRHRERRQRHDHARHHSVERGLQHHAISRASPRYRLCRSPRPSTPPAGAQKRTRPPANTRQVSEMPSASIAFCSTISTVTPRALMLFTVLKIALERSGERPALISSSISTFGRTVSAHASASICRCPPERLPASAP